MARRPTDDSVTPIDAGHVFEPIELGLDSLLWRWADQRMAFTGLTAGLLQLMHPAIGAGVIDHSDFFNDPWDRVFRSIPQIMSVVYSGPMAEKAGRQVRNRHRPIHGRDERDRPYDALDPEVFWFAHATFQHSVHQVADRFSLHSVTLAEREQLYREGVEWYRRYGLSMAPVPRRHADFVTKWAYYCTDVLEMTPAAERVLDLSLNGRAEDMPGLPAWTQPLQRYVLTPIFRLTQIGGLPPTIRDRFGIPWSIQNQLELTMFEEFVRRTWRFLPRSARIPPQAMEGRRRERARLAAQLESAS
jgi:uncharacterized protein (DUF2236 family)